MNKLLILFGFLFLTDLTNGQNIFSALHLNENNEYKTTQPKKILETKTFYTSNGKQVDRYVKIFDEAGMLLREELYDESRDLKARLIYSNDTLNKVILSRTIERWTQLGYSKETAFYTYDSNHYLTGITEKDANGNIIRQTHLLVNQRGNPNELALFDGNGKLFGKELATYLYNKNKVITSVVSNDGRTLSVDTIKINFRKAFMFPEKSEKYNSNGDLTNWKRRNLNGTYTEFEEEYSYDDFGNCTEIRIYKVTTKRNGKRIKEIDRVFEKQYTY